MLLTIIVAGFAVLAIALLAIALLFVIIASMDKEE